MLRSERSERWEFHYVQGLDFRNYACEGGHRFAEVERQLGLSHFNGIEWGDLVQDKLLPYTRNVAESFIVDKVEDAEITGDRVTFYCILEDPDWKH